MCGKQEGINSRVRIKSFDNFKTFFGLNWSIKSQICNTVLKGNMGKTIRIVNPSIHIARLMFMQFLHD